MVRIRTSLPDWWMRWRHGLTRITANDRAIFYTSKVIQNMNVKGMTEEEALRHVINTFGVDESFLTIMWRFVAYGEKTYHD